MRVDFERLEAITMSYIQEVNKTARSRGAVNPERAVVPRYVMSNLKTLDTVLDFGAGINDFWCRNFKAKIGSGYAAFEIGENVREWHDKNALRYVYDWVMLSNVCNVQPSVGHLVDVIINAAHSLCCEGRMVLNFPDPRKGEIKTLATFKRLLRMIFWDVESLGNNLFEVRRVQCYDVDDIVDRFTMYEKLENGAS